MFKKLIKLFSSPSQLFAEIREQPTWLLPWLTGGIALASIQLGFYLLVDTDVLLEQLISASQQPGISENDLRVITQTAVDQKTLLGVASALAASIGLLIWIAINASYLYVIGRFKENHLAYKYWFSLCAWCSLPVVFTALVAWLVILSSGSNIDISALNPLNLSFILSQVTAYSNGFFDFIDLTTFWTLALTIIAYRKFTSESLAKASVVVLAPYIILSVVWGFLG